ncbi:MAG: hypothetical protein NXI00_24320 [Cytophagales bacterium]|nr:hypothetical protein [Cytophagales bacterium]
MINVNSAAVAIIIPWCNKEGRDEKGRQWHTREPDLLIAVENIRKNYQHFRNPNHIVFIVTLASGLQLNGLNPYLQEEFNRSANHTNRNSLRRENWLLSP